MKILFAVQGTGNGHISRAITLLPYLKKYGHVDLLISGKHNGIVPAHPVAYRFEGLGFSFGKNGGIDFTKTFTEAKLIRLIKELDAVPVDKYDVVINDFEPLTAWACIVRQKPCVGLSHQSALLLPGVPLPEDSNTIGNLVLRHYAPVSDGVSFHFKSWHPDIFTPVIRNDLRQANPTDHGHLTVYLPAYSEQALIQFFGKLHGIKVDIFVKGAKKCQPSTGLSVYPVEQESFGRSMTSAHAVMCGAGFETPAEALFMKKKLLVIPMKNQYEQQCNAAALRSIGVKVLPKLDSDYLGEVENWFTSAPIIHVDYPDQNREVFERVFEKLDKQLSQKRNKPIPLEYFNLIHSGYNNLKFKAVSQFF